MDKTDAAVLCELDCNSRHSLAQIGKKVRLSKEGVHYRIKKMEEQGIIKGYPCIVSLAKRGKIHAELFVKYCGVTVDVRREMIEFFAEQPEVVYLKGCKGCWDLLAGIVVDDISSLNRVKNELYDRYSKYWASFKLSLSVENYFFGRKYLRGKDIRVAQHVDKPGRAFLDDKDNAILKTLSRNARISLREIAKVTGLSAKTVAHRIKRLEREKVIQKFTVSIDTELLGITTFKLLLRLRSSKDKSKMLEYLHRQRNVVSTREVLGEWHLEPLFEVGSVKQFYDVLEEMESLFGDSIVSHDSFILDKVYKEEYYA